MSSRGLCYVCNDAAGHTCGSCGGNVCEDHYDSSSGFCVKCARGMTMGD